MGRRERPRLKSEEGKTVRDLTRMLVMVSSRARWGLNWYLLKPHRQLFPAEDYNMRLRKSCRQLQIELIKRSHHQAKRLVR